MLLYKENLPKNNPIDLKIGHIMYLDGFYGFPNFRPKTLKIGRFLTEKPHFLLTSAKKRFITKFWRKLIDLHQFSSKLSNFWYTLSFIYLLQSYREHFGFFAFFSILWGLKVEKNTFFTIFGQFFCKLKGL